MQMMRKRSLSTMVTSIYAKDRLFSLTVLLKIWLLVGTMLPLDLNFSCMIVSPASAFVAASAEMSENDSILRPGTSSLPDDHSDAPRIDNDAPLLQENEIDSDAEVSVSSVKADPPEDDEPALDESLEPTEQHSLGSDGEDNDELIQQGSTEGRKEESNILASEQLVDDKQAEENTNSEPGQDGILSRDMEDVGAAAISSDKSEETSTGSEAAVPSAKDQSASMEIDDSMTTSQETSILLNGNDAAAAFSSDTFNEDSVVTSVVAPPDKNDTSESTQRDAKEGTVTVELVGENLKPIETGGASDSSGAASDDSSTPASIADEQSSETQSAASVSASVEDAVISSLPNTPDAQGTRSEPGACTLNRESMVWWGNFNESRRRYADRDVLYELFEELYIRDHPEVQEVVRSQRGPPPSHQTLLEEIAEARRKLIESMDDDDDDELSGSENPEARKSARKESTKTEPSTGASGKGYFSVNDHFVQGMDDIDKLFEGVDPPDELDIGAAGSSIQEIIMGQGTQILRKRITLGMEFVVQTARQFKTRVSRQLEQLFAVHATNADVDSAPWMVTLQRKAVEISKFVWAVSAGVWDEIQGFVDELGSDDDDGIDDDEYDESSFKQKPVGGEADDSRPREKSEYSSDEPNGGSGDGSEATTAKKASRATIPKKESNLDALLRQQKVR
jgi:hypothetical protein